MSVQLLPLLQQLLVLLVLLGLVLLQRLRLLIPMRRLILSKKESNPYEYDCFRIHYGFSGS